MIRFRLLTFYVSNVAAAANPAVIDNARNVVNDVMALFAIR